MVILERVVSIGSQEEAREEAPQTLEGIIGLEERSLQATKETIAKLVPPNEYVQFDINPLEAVEAPEMVKSIFNTLDMMVNQRWGIRADVERFTDGNFRLAFRRIDRSDVEDGHQVAELEASFSSGQKGNAVEALIVRNKWDETEAARLDSILKRISDSDRTMQNAILTGTGNWLAGLLEKRIEHRNGKIHYKMDK